MSPDFFERFNLRHLRYFLAIADAGSFRAASARLNIAQSAVSRRIADLEAIFAVPLFDRHPRGVTLSAAGEALRHGARRIGAELDAAKAALKRPAGAEALLRVGLYGTTSQLAFVPPLIARFRDELPNTALDLSPIATGEIDAASLATLDVALFENTPAPSGWRAQRLLSSAYVAAVPRGHPLTAPAAISFDVLCEVELICFPGTANPAGHDALIRAAAERGRALNIIHETSSECARLALAAAGMGIAIVSPLAAAHDQGFAVEYRAMTGVTLPFDLWLATQSDAAAAVHFADIAAATVAGLSR